MAAEKFVAMEKYWQRLIVIIVRWCMCYCIVVFVCIKNMHAQIMILKYRIQACLEIN